MASENDAAAGIKQDKPFSQAASSLADQPFFPLGRCTDLQPAACTYFRSSIRVRLWLTKDKKNVPANLSFESIVSVQFNMTEDIREKTLSERRKQAAAVKTYTQDHLPPSLQSLSCDPFFSMFLAQRARSLSCDLLAQRIHRLLQTRRRLLEERFVKIGCWDSEDNETDLAAPRPVVVEDIMKHIIQWKVCRNRLRVQ